MIGAMTQTLADFAAAQMRAEMARREISASQLGRELGVGETWVRRRMKGKYAITLGDLERIARGLDLPVSHFIRDEVAA